jgi:hypothetical protein
VTLDLQSGMLGGFDVYYHDARYILVTWDDQPVRDDQWKTLFTGADRASVLNWGINDPQTQRLGDGELAACVRPVKTEGAKDVEVGVWKRPGSAMLCVAAGGNPATVTFQLDLDRLGVKVQKLWTQYTQCLGGELDPVTGVLTVKTQPGKTNVIYIDTY